MSNTERKRKHAHNNMLKREYRGFHGKISGKCKYNLGYCGNGYGIRSTKGIKRNMRRYVRRKGIPFYNEIIDEVQNFLNDLAIERGYWR